MFTTKCKCGEEITFAIEMAVMTKFCPRCGSIVEVRNGKASVTSSGVPPRPSHAPAPEIPQASLPQATPRRPDYIGASSLKPPHFSGPKPTSIPPMVPTERPRRAEPPRVHTPPLAQTQPFAASRPRYPAQQPPQRPPELQHRGGDETTKEKPHQEPQPPAPKPPEHPREPQHGDIAESKEEMPQQEPRHTVPADGVKQKPADEWANIPIHVIDEDKEGGHHAPPTAPPQPYQQPHAKPAAPPPPAHYPKPPQPQTTYPQQATKSTYDRYTFTPPQDAPKTSGCLVAIIIAVIVCVLFLVLLSATNTKSEPPKKNPTTTPSALPAADSYKDKVVIKVVYESTESGIALSFSIANKGGYVLDRLSFDFRFLDENGNVLKTERVAAITPSATGTTDGPVKGLVGGRDFTMKKKFSGLPRTWGGKYEIEIVDLRIRSG